MPELLPENAEALELWLEIRTQWRVGISGPIGLDYPAVYQEAARLEIDLSNSLMRKIKLIEQAELKRQNEDHGKTKRPQPHSKTVKGRP